MELFDSGFALAGITLILLLVFIGISIFFLITQQKALQAIAPENRLLPPSNVWLQLIPLFNFYYVFVVINKLSASIALEYERLNIEKKELYPTRAIGTATAILYFVSLIPVIKEWASLAWIVCVIIYWVKINECRKKIIANKDNDLLDVERELLKIY